MLKLYQVWIINQIKDLYWWTITLQDEKWNELKTRLTGYESKKIAEFVINMKKWEFALLNK